MEIGSLTIFANILDGGAQLLPPDYLFKTHMLKQGGVIEKHHHQHDHLTLFIAGRFLVEIEGPDGNSSAEFASWNIGGGKVPFWLNIEAHRSHKFTLLEPEQGVGIFWCVYPTEQI